MRTCGLAWMIAAFDRMNFIIMFAMGAVPEGSTICALQFARYGSFEVKDMKCRLLLCIGITEDELELARSEGYSVLVGLLKERGVFPFTDLHRASIFNGE